MKNILLFLICILILCSCRTETEKTVSKVLHKDKQKISLRLMSEPDGLSPILSRARSSREVFRLIFSNLMGRQPESGVLRPVLIKNKPVVEEIEEGLFKGGKKYTMEIRENANWDDGSPITAADYVFSSKIILHPSVKTRYGVVADLIKDIELYPNNAKKLSILTGDCHILTEGVITADLFLYQEKKFDPNLSMRKYPYLTFKEKEKLKGILEADSTVLKVGELFSDVTYARTPGKLSGAGPYKLKEWVTGQKIVLEKKQDWWGENLFPAKPESITFEIIPDHITALTKIKNGEIDLCGELPNDLFKENENNEKLNAYSVASQNLIYLAMNNEKGPLANKKIRQAVAHTVNVAEIIETISYGYAQPISGPYTPDAAFYDKSIKPRSFDIAKAIAILEEEGWKDSNQNGTVDKIVDGKIQELELEFIIASTSRTAIPISELWKNNAKKAGIGVKVITKDSKVFRSENLATGNFDIVATGTSVDPGLYDPKGRWHSESIPPRGGNYPRFNNKEADRLIDEIRSECNDSKRRNKLYADLHALMYEEQPVIFLYNPQNIMLTTKHIEGLVYSSTKPGFFPEYIEVNN